MTTDICEKGLETLIMRHMTGVEEIVFLEYIYFTVYLALLLTCIHTFLFLLKRFSHPIPRST